MSSRPLRAAPEWDDRFARMVVVSAVAHGALIAAAVWVLAHRGDERSLPLVAYTVEITDPNALGGRLPPGAPGKPLTGGQTAPPPPSPVRTEPAPKAEEPTPPPPEAKPPEPTPPVEQAKPPEPKPVEAKPPEPKPEEPTVRLDDKPKPPEPKKVEPPKPQPPPQVAKPEPAKPEPKPPEPPPKPEIAKAQPPKPAPAKPEAAKPEPAKPAAQAPAAGRETNAPPAARDDYAAAAERWRSRSEKQGGGLGGTDVGSGPIGAGGQGPGGGGQLVGIEFLAYRQQVINTVKARWTNVIARPGLVTVIRFEIGTDGTVTGIRVEKSSGNAAYDGSAVRAVQRANPLPAPPARYAREFGEFLIEFHSEESGGQGAG